MILDFARPGKPADNAFIEVFNGRLQAECLNILVHEHSRCSRQTIVTAEGLWCDCPHGVMGNKISMMLISSICASNLKAETLIKLGRNLRSRSIE